MPADARHTRQYWDERVQPYLLTKDAWRAVGPAGEPEAVARMVLRTETAGVKALAAALPRGRVIEVGCGYGRWFPTTAPGCTLIGVDFASSLVALAQQTSSVPVFVADARCIAARSGWFDGAYTVKVLQMVPHANRPAAVADLFRLVRPGGVVALFEKLTGDDGSPADAWVRWAEQAGGRLVHWEGNHFMVVDRAMTSAARRVRRPTPAGPSAGLPPSSRRWYRAARFGMVASSLALEPVARRVLPKTAATHGIFVFRSET